jgi:hypothetical protein
MNQASSLCVCAGRAELEREMEDWLLGPELGSPCKMFRVKQSNTDHEGMTVNHLFV